MILRNTFYATSFVLSFGIISSFAQSSPKADSLKTELSKTNEVATISTLLKAICDEYRFRNVDSMYLNAQRLYTHAEKHGLTEEMASAEIYYCWYFNTSGQYNEALRVSLKNIEVLKASENKALLTKFYSMAGNSEMRLNRQKDAVEHFLNVLRLAEETNSAFDQLAAYNNLGWAFLELHEYPNAIKYLQQAIKTIKSNNIENRYGVVYNNLGSSYAGVNKLDSAIKYVTAGVEIALQYSDFSTAGNSYSMLGDIYAKQKKYDLAIKSFQDAKSAREKAGDAFYIVSDMASIANLYAQTGNTAKGISIAKEALAIADKNNITAKRPMILTALALNYEAASKFKEATATYKLLKIAEDSLFKSANAEALAEMQTRYETEKKQQQIESLSQQNTIHQLTNSRQQVYFGGGILILILLGSIVYQYQRAKLFREKTLHDKKLKEQQELAAQAVIETELSERRRIAAELHDGVVQTFSAARMNLSGINGSLAFSNPAHESVYSNTMTMIDEGCTELRSISHSMMPEALLKKGLPEALRELTNRIDAGTTAINSGIYGFHQRLHSSIETSLYRIIQESVNNTLKHAHATTMDIQLSLDENNITLTLEDNGKGFDATEAASGKGIGLRNIMSRVSLLSGTCEIDSKAGKGALIVITLPVRKANEN